MRKQEQGFTILEAMIAILIATIFVATAMQMMAMAAAFKARARQYAEATTWIQADLEVVKDQADQLPLPSTTLTANAAAGATSLTVDSVRGFAVGDTLKVGSNANTYTIASGGINTATKTITLTGGIATTQTTGSQILARCKLSPLTPNTTTGFGDYLKNNLPAKTDINPNTGDTTILGRNFTISRIANVKNTDPYEVLELFYSVAPTDAHTILSTAATATSTTLSVASASGFKVGDKLTVGTDVDNEIQSISGNTITLTAQLGSAQSSGAIVDVSIAVLNTEVMPNAALQCPQ